MLRDSFISIPAIHGMACPLACRLASSGSCAGFACRGPLDLHEPRDDGISLVGGSRIRPSILTKPDVDQHSPYSGIDLLEDSDGLGRRDSGYFPI